MSLRLARVSTVLLGAVWFVASTPARAQDFNIDVGEDSALSNGVPSPTYGAAANQPGVWNAVSDGASGSGAPAGTTWYVTNNLLKLDGTPSTVSVSVHQGLSSPGVGDFAFDIPTTSGDDEKLLDDVASFGAGTGSAEWNFSNLQPGFYDVYTYAFAPDDPSFETHINAPSFNLYSDTVTGGWTGAYVLEKTHTKQTLLVDTDGTLSIHFSTFHGGASVNGMQLVYHENEQIYPYCFGDGSFPENTCPCSNVSAAGHGCPNSVFAGGALLSATGTASVTSDTLSLTASSLTGNLVLFIQGEYHQTAFIDDGRLCIASPQIRVGVKAISSNGATAPSGTDVPLSVSGAIPAIGAARYYQAVYRNSVFLYCTSLTTNHTNGVAVLWTP